jgi:Tfp pilus assembly protein PilP
LIGIGEDASAEGPVRTAIISAPGQLFVVKVGDRVTPRYRVDRISADVVELTEVGADGSTLRLALR